jgi:hypothetical protein
VQGDHGEFSDGNAVVCGTCFVRDELYVLAQIRLEIRAAGSDLENLAGIVFRNGIGALRATHATFDVDLVCISAGRGSLCKPHCDQQGRYNEQQEYSLHGILRELSPCGGLNSAWG